MSIEDKAINLELMLAGWSETHSGGAKITFWIDSDSLEPFKHMTAKKGNTAGQRFMAALVQIGADERPMDRDKPRDPLRMSAVMLCKEPAFQKFAAQREGYQCLYKDEAENAAVMVRHFCEVESRADLDKDDKAAQRFARLMEMYREWRREEGLEDSRHAL